MYRFLPVTADKERRFEIETAAPVLTADKFSADFTHDNRLLNISIDGDIG